MSANSSVFERWNCALGPLLQRLDQPDCLQYLIEAIEQLVDVKAVILSLERRGKVPTLIFETRVPANKRRSHIDDYFSGAFLLDPFCLAVEEGLAPGFYHLSEIAPDDFTQSEYYRVYYREAQLVDDAYYIMELAPGVQLSLALGRLGAAPPYSETELTLLRQIRPVVEAVLLRYWQQQSGTDQALPQEPPPGLRDQIEAAFNNFGSSLLTQREREVAHLLLRGHSSKSAARKLDISPDTVQMHRKNLYAKLDISSQAELFVLFIEALSHAGGKINDDPLIGYIDPQE
ncbi:response regulator transcription factor [Motiliproteus sp.]|uniref:helix-turn-helix transcriptional regulator n=1 Tax=Motiliproteus sp. TaxID=1898955 RepID=UPI003BA947F4